MNPPRRFPVLTLVLIAATVGLAPAADPPAGEQIYLAKCAWCHGKNGEGSKRYDQKLEGDRSAAQLAQLIRQTMPEDDPESLTVADAEAVAGYVYHQFYSPLARERNRPARVGLARLTAKQHRNALADLIGSFRWKGWWGDERGLKAGYYTFKSGWYNPEDRVLERTDPRVEFDFGTETPVPDKLDPHKFAAQWTGSLWAPETGEYEFVIRTDHSARFYINDYERPLIDAWVKSGTDTEFRGSTFLVGGHVYLIRLDFAKAKQGVDDSKKDKDKPKPPPPPAMVGLLWRTPHGPTEVIPEHRLTPAAFPPRFVCATPFPPDDRSYGWERGTSISKEWAAATTEAAIETAAYVAAHLDDLAGIKPEDGKKRRSGRGIGNPSRLNFEKSDETAVDRSERDRKLREFAGKFVERAFRRPLTPEQAEFLDRQFRAGPDADAAIKRVVLWALKSPRFLYREVGGENDAFDVASRLAFALWDSIPDEELWKAAAAGELATKEQIQKQAWRMLYHTAGRAKARNFLLTWLKADGTHDLAKDPEKFPGFGPEIIADLKASLEMFLDEVFWSEKSDYRHLVRADEIYLNDRLAAFFGAEAVGSPGFRKVRLDDGRRSGVLTHPYILTTFAHGSESSPIQRGVFLARGMLGVSLKPPPEAVAPLAPDLHPTLSTRERVAMQTRPAACMTCHGVINPLGFTLENFDAVGRFRTEDRGKPVDPIGSYTPRDGQTVTVTGANELGEFLADSAEAHAAFCEQLFHHYAQQPVRAYGPDTLAELKQKFAWGGYNMRNLMVEAAVLAALQPRPESVSLAP